MAYTVYCHTNKTNGKRYFGITRQRPTKRWQNGKGYKGCTYFNRAIQECGWDGFSHDIIATDLPEEEAKEMEIYLISKSKSYLPEFGYNISRGGDGETKYATPEEAHEAYRRQMREFNQRNKDKAKKWHKEFLAKNPDYNKNYYASHKGYFHNRYINEPSETKDWRRQYARKYRENNPEKAKEATRRYREAHHEEYKAYMRAYHRRKKEETLLCRQ